MRLSGHTHSSTRRQLADSPPPLPPATGGYVVWTNNTSGDVSVPLTVLPSLTDEEYWYAIAYSEAFSTNWPEIRKDFYGFEQLTAVLFWFGCFFALLSGLQMAVQGVSRMWRKQMLSGLFDPPRLQFLLLTLSLLALSWPSSQLIMSAYTPWGPYYALVTGVIVLYFWPFLFTLFAFALVWYIVIQEQYARFFVREMTEPRNESFFPWLARTFWKLLRQKRLKGHWVTITPSQKHILPRFGIFFEDYTVWGSQSKLGILKDRMRAVYGSFDCLKMMLVGLLLGGWNYAQNSVTQQVLLFFVSLSQFLYLVLLQPFTERSLQVVESASVLVEVIVFMCTWGLAANPETPWPTANSVGLFMLFMVAMGFFGQVFNHWMALGLQINRMLNPVDEEKSPSNRSESDSLSEDDDDDDEDDDDDDEDDEDEDDYDDDDEEEDDEDEEDEDEYTDEEDEDDAPHAPRSSTRGR